MVTKVYTMKLSKWSNHKMDHRLRSYDWEAAFGECDYACTYGLGSSPNPSPPDSSVSLAPVTREDVAEILAIEEGERDDTPWRIVFRVKDGRFGYLTAGCDYTGWD